MFQENGHVQLQNFVIIPNELWAQSKTTYTLRVGISSTPSRPGVELGTIGKFVDILSRRFQHHKCPYCQFWNCLSNRDHLSQLNWGLGRSLNIHAVMPLVSIAKTRCDPKIRLRNFLKSLCEFCPAWGIIANGLPWLLYCCCGCLWSCSWPDW